MQKKISVIIPVYNAGQTLAGCLDGIFALDYGNFEVIAIDDCSDDNSVEIIKRYPAKLISLPERRGPAYARNAGVSMADGEIVAFLDADCLVPKDWLKKINLKLRRDIVGIGGRYSLSDQVNIFLKLLLAYLYIKDILYRKPRELISLNGGNCAFWTSQLLRGRAKSELAYCKGITGSDDTLMCCELAKFGKLIFDPDISVVHNLKHSLPGIFKRAVSYACAGAKTARPCLKPLIHEPHYFIKGFYYLISLFLFFMAFSILFLPLYRAAFYFSLFYILSCLPLAVLIYRRFLKSPFLIFLPPAVFLISMLNFAGHLKALARYLRGRFKSLAWYFKFIINLMRPSRLSRVFFFVTKDCNARCYFCFNKNGDTGYNGIQGDLALKEIERLAGNAGFLPWLVVTGGEPFLRNDLYDICRLFYDKCQTRFITIATNGILTERIKEAAERLLSDCEFLRLAVIIALDDISGKHDKLKGVDGCYENALKTLERLNAVKARHTRLSLGINTILVKENAADIENILDYFSGNLDYDWQYLNPLRKGAHSGIGPQDITQPGYLSLLRRANGKAGARFYSFGRRFKHALLEYCCEKHARESAQGRSLDTCVAAQKFCVINNNGDILACELLPGSLGSLRDAGFELNRIMKSQAAGRVRSAIRQSGCHCRWPCAITSNAVFNSGSYRSIIGKMAHGYLRG